MLKDDRIKQALIAKFKQFIAMGGGGIFRTKTRERLLQLRSPSGRDRTKNDFWYDVRNRVRNALFDLELFIETSDKEQVKQVLTRESLEPVISAFLNGFVACSESELEPNRTEVADMLIRQGFGYLERKSRSLTLSHERTIKEAVDLSNYILSIVKGTRYHPPRDLGLR